ncbi:putative Ig domain-containing protein [Halalkalibaculum sp. DA3122]|uniref:putative Ig domain-containing protein n=1 Tax=Halalkalibaculum sp. DA3122 TaxID=3373607 RepID=UPI003755277C
MDGSVINSGTISSAGNALRIDGAIGGTLVNESGGTLESTGSVALQLGSADHTVINRGDIAGGDGTAVNLGDGDDTFTAESGTITGSIEGGAGNDILIGSDAGEHFAGDDGDDLVRPGKGADTITLGNGADQIQGTPEELNGDTVTDATTGNSLLVTSTTGLSYPATVRTLSGKIEIDVDGDGFGSADDIIVHAPGIDTLSLDITEKAGNTRISIIENRPPVITSSPAATVDENSTGTVFDVEAHDGDGGSSDQNITYALGGTDSGRFSLDPQTGKLEFNNSPDYESPADEDQDNVYELLIEADDGLHSVSQNLTVTVADTRPVLSDQQIGAINETASNSAVVGYISTEGDPPATFKITGGDPDGIFAVDNSGKVTVADDTGLDYETTSSYGLTVEVNDKPGSPPVAAVMTVNINDVDEAPVFITRESGSIAFSEQDTNPVIDIDANDGDGGRADENVSYRIANSGDGPQFTIDPSTGLLTFASAPDYEAPADNDGDNEYTVTVETDDGENSTSQTFTINVTDVNDPPVISGDPPTSINQGAAYSFTPSASDPDGDEVTFSIQNKPDWLSFDPATGQLSGTPGNDDVGTFENITISVSDPDDASASLPAFDLTVDNRNDAPVVDAGIEDQEATQNNEFRFTVPDDAFADPDAGDTITLSVSGLPEGLQFNSSDNSITGVPTDTDLGENTVQVTATDQAGTDITTTFTLTVRAEVPSRVALAAPIDSDSDIDLSPTFLWKKISPATHYELQIATAASFEQESLVLQETDIETNQHILQHPLSRNATYYWRVRGINHGTAGSWSEAFSFTTVPNPPDQITLVKPSDGDLNMPLLPSLSWEPTTGAETYELRLSTDRSFSSPVVEVSSINGTSFEISPELDTETRYYWQVRGVNAGGDGAWSKVYQFKTVPAAPKPVTLSTPLNETGSVSMTPELTWKPVDGAETYQLQLAADENFRNVIFSQSDLAATSFRLSDPLEDNQRYFWRVRAQNSGGSGNWSPYRQFYTRAHAPVLRFPAPREEGISIAPQLTWTSEYEEVRFRVRLAGDIELQNLVADTLADAREVAFSGLETDTDYYWTVRVETPQTRSDWSPTRRFTTRAPSERTPADVEIVFGDDTGGGEPDAGASDDLQSFDYRLVGLPGSEETPVRELFEGDYGTDWKVFADNGEPEDYLVEFSGTQAFNFRAGVGYWILSRNPVNIDDEIPPVTISDNDTYSITLRPGWNIISNPFTRTADWEQIEVFNNFSAPLFGYEGSFSESEQMQPYRGYYLYNDTGSEYELEIPYTSLAKRGNPENSRAKKKTDPQRVELDIAATDYDLQSTIAIAYASDPEVRKELNQYHPPLNLSRFGAAIEQKQLGKRKQLLYSLGDSHDSRNNHYIIRVKSETATTTEWTVRMEGMDSQSGVLVTNPQSGRSEILNNGDRYRLAVEKGITKFEVYTGSRSELDAVREGLLPQQISLKQNYPNPFNPTTTIRYGLNSKNNVLLEVYNILGRKVGTLVDQAQSAGWHEVSFDASRLASGTYFYRIKIGQQIKTRKMILIK